MRWTRERSSWLTLVRSSQLEARALLASTAATASNPTLRMAVGLLGHASESKGMRAAKPIGQSILTVSREAWELLPSTMEVARA